MGTTVRGFSAPMRVTPYEIRLFLERELQSDEARELARILKCKKIPADRGLAEEIVINLLRRYQTPFGFIVRTPTLDDICRKLSKKLQLRAPEGEGWDALYDFAVNFFEHMLATMPLKRKEELIMQIWDGIEPEKKQHILEKLNMSDFNTMIKAIEELGMHEVGIHFARSGATLGADVLAGFEASEIALLTSQLLSRGVASVLGPIGWVLMVSSVNQFMGTNLKTVVPAVLIINAVRLRVYPRDF